MKLRVKSEKPALQNADIEWNTELYMVVDRGQSSVALQRRKSDNAPRDSKSNTTPTI
jgi:hypothetical protein